MEFSKTVILVQNIPITLFNLVAKNRIFFQPEWKTTLTIGALTSGASEAGVSVIVTTTVEDREVVRPLPCARGIIGVG